MDEIISQLRTIVGNVRSDLDVSALPATASLEDAGLDSLDLASALLEAQEAFDVTFPDEELGNLTTIQTIAEYIQANRG